MDSEKIGKFIKSIRLKEKISQQKFAERYGVTYQAVSKWETGKNIPDLAILKQICSDYDMNLDDFLATKIPYSKKKKLYIMASILVFVIIGIIIFTVNHQKNFEFKTLSSNCDNFNLFGSIAYDDKKSSIYISNITYCGNTDKNNYQKINCTLYENDNGKKTKISSFNYDQEELIKLDDFLKSVNFNIDNYVQKCKSYQENSLYLEIDALNEKNEKTTYEIPLQLKDNC